MCLQILSFLVFVVMKLTIKNVDEIKLGPSIVKTKNDMEVVNDDLTI